MSWQTKDLKNCYEQCLFYVCSIWTAVNRNHTNKKHARRAGGCSSDCSCLTLFKVLENIQCVTRLKKEKGVINMFFILLIQSTLCTVPLSYTRVHAHTHTHTQVRQSLQTGERFQVTSEKIPPSNLHSSSSALKDYRDYAGITWSESLSLCRPTWVCNVRAFPWPFLRDLQVNLPSGGIAKGAHSAGRDKNSKVTEISPRLVNTCS